MPMLKTSVSSCSHQIWCLLASYSIPAFPNFGFVLLQLENVWVLYAVFLFCYVFEYFPSAIYFFMFSKYCTLWYFHNGPLLLSIKHLQYSFINNRLVCHVGTVGWQDFQLPLIASPHLMGLKPFKMH